MTGINHLSFYTKQSIRSHAQHVLTQTYGHLSLIETCINDQNLYHILMKVGNLIHLNENRKSITFFAMMVVPRLVSVYAFTSTSKTGSIGRCQTLVAVHTLLV